MIAVGLGCRRGCAERELVRVVSEALAQAGLGLADVQALCAPDWKHAEAGLIAAAATLDKPLVFLPLAALARESARALSHSPAVLARFGVPSIAETAALAGARCVTWKEPRDAGTRPTSRSTCARLLGPRHTSAAASCALASLSETP